MRFYDAYLHRSRYNVKFQTKAHMKMHSEYRLEIIFKKNVCFVYDLQIRIYIILFKVI